MSRGCLCVTSRAFMAGGQISYLAAMSLYHGTCAVPEMDSLWVDALAGRILRPLALY